MEVEREELDSESPTRALQGLTGRLATVLATAALLHALTTRNRDIAGQVEQRDRVTARLVRVNSTHAFTKLKRAESAKPTGQQSDGGPTLPR